MHRASRNFSGEAKKFAASGRILEVRNELAVHGTACALVPSDYRVDAASANAGSMLQNEDDSAAGCHCSTAWRAQERQHGIVLPL